MTNYHYEKARLLAEQGRWDLAEKEALAAIAAVPESDRAYNILSYCYSRQGRHEAAISAAQQAISLSPENAGHYYRLADVCERAAQYKLATAAIETCLSLNPTDEDAYSLAASICLSRRDIKSMLTFTAKGLSLNPEHESCWNKRVLGLLVAGRLDEANQEAERLMAGYPDRAFSHAARGWLAIYQRKFQPAFGSFKVALQIDPNSEWARQGLIEALKTQNIFYRWILPYKLWQARLDRSSRVALTVLLIFPPFRGLYLLLMLLSWAVGGMANITLRFHPYGRLLFPPKEK